MGVRPPQAESRGVSATRPLHVSLSHRQEQAAAKLAATWLETATKKKAPGEKAQGAKVWGNGGTLRGRLISRKPERPSPMLKLTDQELDAVFSCLSPVGIPICAICSCRRSPVPCSRNVTAEIGPGTVTRICRDFQRQFWTPDLDHRPGVSRSGSSRAAGSTRAALGSNLRQIGCKQQMFGGENKPQRAAVAKEV